MSTIRDLEEGRTPPPEGFETVKHQEAFFKPLFEVVDKIINESHVDVPMNLCPMSIKEVSDDIVTPIFYRYLDSFFTQEGDKLKLNGTWKDLSDALSFLHPANPFEYKSGILKLLLLNTLREYLSCVRTQDLLLDSSPLDSLIPEVAPMLNKARIEASKNK